VAVGPEGPDLDDGGREGHREDEHEREQDGQYRAALAQEHHRDDGEREPGQELVRGAEERPDDHSARAVGAHTEGETETEDEDDDDRKSTRLNSSHVKISYAVFCLKK